MSDDVSLNDTFDNPILNCPSCGNRDFKVLGDVGSEKRNAKTIVRVVTCEQCGLSFEEHFEFNIVKISGLPDKD